MLCITSNQKVDIQQVTSYECCCFTLMKMACLLVCRLLSNTVDLGLLSYGNIHSELERVRMEVGSLFEDNTWNLTEGLNKTTETFSWVKWYNSQDLGPTEERS
jgi:hypothetical protein